MSVDSSSILRGLAARIGCRHSAAGRGVMAAAGRRDSLTPPLVLLAVGLVLATLLAVPRPLHADAGTAAGPQDAPQPEFLANQPTFAGLMEVNDDFAVGGGFLYWWQCRGPAAAADVNAPAAQGYLRRWPLAGGKVATLADLNFCPDIITADADGLYYWEAGQLRRRSLEDPTNPVNLLPLRQPRSQLVLDGQFVYFIYDNGYVMRWPKFTVWLDERYDDLLEPMAESGAGPSNLVLSGSDLMWFGDGWLYALNKGCLLGGCTRSIWANEAGGRLSAAALSGPSAGDSTNPLWVANRKMRGVRCRIGTTCTTRTVYDPQGNAPPEQRYEVGRMAYDGRYLFWLENYQTCNPFGCSFGDFGELRRWDLDQTVSPGSPAPLPETILAKTSTYYLPRTLDAPLAVGNGWVYFRTNLGITRLRVDAPPAPPDVRVTGWEVTQGIQAPGLQANGNDVPLVAGKPTYVRLYGRRAGGPRTNGIKARLEGWKAGGYLGAIRPLNGYASLAFPLPGGNEIADRTRMDNSWLFQLPDRWTEWGSISLKATIESPSLDRDVAREFYFVDAAPICTVFIPVRAQNRVRLFGPDHDFAIEMAERLLPTPKIWRFSQDNDIAKWQPRFGIPPWEYVPFDMGSDSTRVLLALLLRDKLSDDPDVCDNASARTHYVGVVAGDPNGDGMDTSADGDNGSSFRGWDQMYFRLPFPAGVRPSQGWQYQRAPTMAHELGHDYDRLHVNCPVGDPEDTDPSYPYPTCQMDLDNAANRHYGLLAGADAVGFTIIMPTSTGDLMSYAHKLNPAKPRWTSDWSWKGILAEIPGGYYGLPDQPGLAAAAGQAASALSTAAVELASAADAVLLRGTINTTSPTGSALDYAWVVPTNAVSRRMLAKWQGDAAPGYAARAAAPTAASYHVRLRDAAGALLDDRTVTLPATSDPAGTGAPFFLTFPAPAGAVARIELLDGETLLAQRAPGGSTPALALLQPAGGETFDADMTLAWRAADPDAGDALLFSVQYSSDDGQTWRTLLTDFPNLSGTDTTTVTLRSLLGTPGSKTVSRVRVLASDGYHTTLATSPAFTVSNRPPQPYIDLPAAGQTVAAGGGVILRGGANDAEDGVIGGPRLAWLVTGPLPAAVTGMGRQLTLAGLAPGTYHATLSATDSIEATTSAEVGFSVAPLTPPAIPAPALDGSCDDDAYAAAARLELKPYDDGASGLVLFGRSGEALYACFTGLPRTGGTSPGAFASLRVDPDLSQSTVPEAADYEFYVGEDGVPVQKHGEPGGWAPPGPGGFTARVSADDTAWNAELRVDLAALGGWGRAVGVIFDHNWVNAVGDNHPWPHTAQANVPSTWAMVVLGSRPQVTALTPPSGTAGGELALTAGGADFSDGAVVLWDGTALPTTFVDSATLQTLIPAGLAVAGEHQVAVANPEPGHPTSDPLAFLVSNPAPIVAGASLDGSTLTVSGSRFVAGAEVLWNGLTLLTTFGDAGQLTAEVDAAAIPANGTIKVAVANPDPAAGLSNTWKLVIGQGGGTRTLLPIVLRR